MKITKILVCIVITCITAVLCAVVASAYDITYHTQDEIRQKYIELALDDIEDTEYKKEYSLKSPYYQGEISDKNKTQALNMLNFIRYTAGLPDNVKINNTYGNYAQCAALVNALNGGLSHFPSKPSGLSDGLYKDGYFGSGKSNLGLGYDSVCGSLVSYMNDSDSSNIDRVGHRRWLLYPGMNSVGFGMVGKHTATYVIGDDFWSDSGFGGDYVCWPPKNMPYELYTEFDRPYAFSVNLSDKYNTPSLNSVKVEVSSEKLGKSWKLDSSCNDRSGKYLTVENSNYGMSKCIIFNAAHFPKDDKVNVRISGISYTNGTPAVIEYDVNFFNIIEYPKSIDKCSFSSLKDVEYIGGSVRTWITVKDNGKFLDEGTDYTLSFRNNDSIGTSEIVVKGIGNYKGEKILSYDIVPKKSVLYVKYSKGKYNLSWSRAAGVDGYQIYYSTNGKNYKKAGSVSGSKLSCSLNLKKGKTYYFKIRSYKNSGGKKYYSQWSDVVRT